MPRLHQKFKIKIYRVLKTQRKAFTYVQINMFVNSGDIPSFQNVTNISTSPQKGLTP